MVLVDDRPVTVDFAQADRQAEIERLNFGTGLRARALHRGGDESDVVPGCDVHFLDIENDRIAHSGEEQVFA